jgi:hypothetical protein
MISKPTTGGVKRYIITLQTSRIGAASQQCDKFATVTMLQQYCNSVAEMSG